MILHLELPEDLAKRFEYIPETLLPEIVIDVLRKGFCEASKDVQQKSSLSASEDDLLRAILEKLKAEPVESTVSRSDTASKEVGADFEFKIKQEEPVIFDLCDEDEDALGDLLGMLK